MKFQPELLHHLWTNHQRQEFFVRNVLELRNQDLAGNLEYSGGIPMGVDCGQHFGNTIVLSH